MVMFGGDTMNEYYKYIDMLIFAKANDNIIYNINNKAVVVSKRYLIVDGRPFGSSLFLLTHFEQLCLIDKVLNDPFRSFCKDCVDYELSALMSSVDSSFAKSLKATKRKLESFVKKNEGYFALHKL